jgi:outer membrane protein OmpA-like peptidoglycan-associated protein
MKTRAILMLIGLVYVTTMFSQEYKPQIGYSVEDGSKTNFRKNLSSDNVFISIAGGGNALWGDGNNKVSLGDRIAFSGAISAGKWYSPYLGFRLQLNGGLTNNFSYESEQELLWVNPHLDIMWDLTNFWAPYKESRLFHVIPYVGAGYGLRAGMTDKVAGIEFPRSESATLNAGVLLSFRLSARVDLFLEANYTLLGDHWNRDQLFYDHEYDRTRQVLLGLNFSVGRKEFEVIEPMDYKLLNDLNAQINALRAENADLEVRPVTCPECVPAASPVIISQERPRSVVFFRLNSSRIDQSQEVTIFNIAEYSKLHNTSITLIGYADRRTGNPTYNTLISERRARAVAKHLIEKHGIPSSSISIEWKGDTEQPYTPNDWNRIVIMDAKE